MSGSSPSVRYTSNPSFVRRKRSSRGADSDEATLDHEDRDKHEPRGERSVEVCPEEKDRREEREPLLDLGKITGYTWSSALVFLLLVVALYALYGIGYWLVARGKGRLALIFAVGSFFCAELIWAYPATAVDVFGYIAHGRLLVLHEVNPFIVPPAEFPGDAMVRYLAFPGEPSQYGPIWVLETAPLGEKFAGTPIAEHLAITED